MAWFPVSPWKLRPGTAQKVAIGATTASSSPIGAGTHAIFLTVTADCHIKITNPGTAAVATDILIKAAWPGIVLGCSPSDVVTVIQDASAGSLYFQELDH